MKRKIISFMLFAILALSLCACANKDNLILFDSAGGTEISNYLNSVDKEPIPQKENYIFCGWYTNKDSSGERIVFPYKTQEDITLYAKWEIDKRSPAEKYIEDDKIFNSDINGKTNFIFKFDPTKQLIHVQCRFKWDYKWSGSLGGAIYFRFEYEFEIGDIENGMGNITAPQCNYKITIKKSGNKGNIIINYKMEDGTIDWFDSLTAYEVKSSFYNKIPSSFNLYYNWCYDNYKLTVY